LACLPERRSDQGEQLQRNSSKGKIVARKTIEQRLAELDAQRSALKARLSKQDRTNDTRRKVLLGALVLHRLENANDPEFTKRLGDWLRRELPGFLTRDNDKALFADLLGAAPSGAAENSNSTETAS
jgi:hypothetical protein